MNLLQTYAEMLADQLNGHLSFDKILPLIEKPKYAKQGDLAFPCFSLAKTMRKAPHQIGGELAETLEHPLFEKIVSEGPYVNGFFNKKAVSRQVLQSVLQNGEQFGSHQFGYGKNIVIDFSSPNIAKPFSMGH